MKNFIEHGEVFEWTVSGSPVASGDVVIIGALLGVAAISANVGDLCRARRGGVYTLPSDTGTAYAQGDTLYWDGTAKRVTKTSSANTKAGVAFTGKASGDTSTPVLLSALAG